MAKIVTASPRLGIALSQRNPARRWSRDMERDKALKNCANCPHQNDCLKVGSCLDDINAQYLATRPNQFPRLMTPAQATTFMNRLRAGEAVRRMTNGGKLGDSLGQRWDTCQLGQQRDVPIDKTSDLRALRHQPVNLGQLGHRIGSGSESAHFGLRRRRGKPVCRRVDLGGY
jgi:hypothetical protein